MKLKPLYDRVLVKRVQESKQTVGGIHIPDAVSTEKFSRAEVLAVGDGKLLDSGIIRPLTVQPGNVVIFAKHGGTEIRADGDTLLVLREDEILCVVEQ